MASRRTPDPTEIRDALAAVSDWLRDATVPAPQRALLANAVRLTARAFAVAAPGGSVELRVPPFIAVQCISGPRHTRGTPPNVMETDPRTWLQLIAGLITLDEAVAARSVLLSGTRSPEIGQFLPLIVD